MDVNMKENLATFIQEIQISDSAIQLPDVLLDADKVRVIMINEVPPRDPSDFFYSKSANPDYMKTTIPLFENAGVMVQSMNDILQLGIYITTAVKKPKSDYTVSTELIKEHMPILAHEIEMFPNLKVIMLMGDVAKKAFNMIARKNKSSSITGSTYKIRQQEHYCKGIRVFPSYIMTGGNILIEKSKCTMISEDIRNMMEIIK